MSVFGIKYQFVGCCQIAQTEAKAVFPRSPDWQADFQSCHNIKTKPSAYLLWVSSTYSLRECLLPQKRINDLQRVVGTAEAASFAGLCVFVPHCTRGGAAGFRVSFFDDTQRKSACDGVKDHGSQALGDRLTSADIESDEGRNVVKTIVFKLEQLPRVALRQQGRHAQKCFNHSLKKISHSVQPADFSCSS